MPRELVFVLPWNRPRTWNDFFNGRHWGRADTYKDKTVKWVQSYLGPLVEDEELFSRVRIRFDVYFDKRPYDADNVCLKPHIDALKGLLIKDDNIKHFAEYKVLVHKDRANPRIVLTITELLE